MASLDERVVLQEPIARRLLGEAYRERWCSDRDLALASGAGSIVSYVVPELQAGLPVLLGLAAYGLVRMNAPSRGLHAYYASDDQVLYKAPFAVLDASVPISVEPHPTRAWYLESCVLAPISESAHDLIVAVDHLGYRFTSALCKARSSLRIEHAIQKGSCDLITVGGGSRILDAY